MDTVEEPSAAALAGNAYSHWKGWQREDFAKFSRSDARYFGWHVRRCMASAAGTSARPLRTLEIGFGNGSFMGWCRAQGFDVAGTEVQAELLQRAAAAGFASAGTAAALPSSEPYDLVVAFDVLEHIPRNHWDSFIGDIAARLGPGGRVLLRVPNGDSPFGRMNQHGDITHAATFGRDKLQQLAELHGLTVVASGDAPWTHRQGMSRTASNLWRAVARGLLERWILFAYAWSGVSLAPNLVVVLARPGG